MEFLRDDSGQGLVEYALIIALIAVVCIATLNALGTHVDNTADYASNALS